MATQTLIVDARGGVRVRRNPFVGDNVVGSLAHGARVEVQANVQQTSADGWVWRRVVAATDQWVAEVNSVTGMRLLKAESEPEPIEPPKPKPPPQTLRVIVGSVNVRAGATTSAGRVRQVEHDELVQVDAEERVIGPAGWVWRRIVDTDPVEWIAEFNQLSGMQLLEAVLIGEPAQGRVQTSGTRFLLDDRPFRFIGCNLREFVFYGTSLLPAAQLAHQDIQLTAAKGMGMKIVRIHACHHLVNIDQTLPLLRHALDAIHRHGMLAIVVLNDSVGLSGYSVPSGPVQPSDKQMREGMPLGHPNKQHYFINEGYKLHFTPFVRRVVTEFKNHQAIFAWEMGNEYAIHPQIATWADSQAFVRFAHNMAQLIRSLDEQHLITIGLLNSNQVAPAGHDIRQFIRTLYGNSAIDFGTVHFYQDNGEEARGLTDLDVLKQMGKPLIVEEFGSAVGRHDRMQYATDRLNQWFGRGAAGFMQWGFSATGRDIGVGDNSHGMDDYSTGNRPLFAAMSNLYQSWGNQLRHG